MLNWGDARIGNMLYRDFAPIAVLDWEMATVGPREVDLAWMIFLAHVLRRPRRALRAAGHDRLHGSATSVIAEYEQLTGHTVRNLEWFEVFAALRFAIVSIRTSTRGIAYGTMEEPADPDDLIMFRSLLEQMLAGTYWS